MPPIGKIARLRKRDTKRRQFLRAATGITGALTASQIAGGTRGEDEERYVAGWYIENKEEAYNGDAEPIIRETYEIVQRKRRNKVRAQKNIEEKIAKRLTEIGNEKDVELIRPTLFNRTADKEIFTPGIRIDYTHFNGSSPDIEKGKVKSEFEGVHEGESGNGESHDIRVTVEKRTQNYTSCDDPQDYEVDQDYIEAGVAFECQANNEHNGTTGAYAYDSNDGQEVWMSVAHICENIGDNCYQWGNGVGTSPYFGEVHERAAGGIHNGNDMAIVANDPDDADEPRRYIFANPDCSNINWRFTEAHSNAWIENNQGHLGYNQGRTTGRDDGDIQYRPNTLSYTDPQVEVTAEGADGDSGGPLYEISYNDKYSENQAYILGCIAYTNSDNSTTWGNTYESYQNHFDIYI